MRMRKRANIRTSRRMRMRNCHVDDGDTDDGKDIDKD